MKKTFLPSKKFIISLITITLIALAIIYVPDIIARQKSKKAEEVAPNTTIEITVGDTLKLDTDGDGLEDWEEALWGTDPLDRDTDNNGTSDFDEVRRAQETRSVALETEEEAEISIEDTLARELYTTVALLDANGEITQEQIDEVAQNFARRVGEIGTTRYVVSDLTIIAPSNQGYLDYAQNIQDAFEAYPLLESDVLPVLAAGQSGESDETVVAVAQKYQTLTDTLLNTEVPGEATIEHLRVVNATQAYAETVARIINDDEEPLLALKALADFQNVIDELIASYQELANVFTLNP